MTRRSSLFAFFALIALAVPVAAGATASADAAWAALERGGHVALVRHGHAPGRSPDPPNFRLEDCATQRGLDERGQALRRHGVQVERVLSSPWCRCLETARLMGYSPGIFDALYNLMGPNPDRERQRRDFRATVAAWNGPGTLLLVSHGVTIGFLTGEAYPAEAEIIVLAPDPAAERGFRLVGRIAPGH